jgi:hypothetical protein
MDAEAVERAAWAQLSSCYDPEIPIDIVNLGLVYACTAEALSRRHLPPRGQHDADAEAAAAAWASR